MGTTILGKFAALIIIYTAAQQKGPKGGKIAGGYTRKRKVWRPPYKRGGAPRANRPRGAKPNNEGGAVKAEEHHHQLLKVGDNNTKQWVLGD